MTIAKYEGENEEIGKWILPRTREREDKIMTTRKVDSCLSSVTMVRNFSLSSHLGILAVIFFYMSDIHVGMLNN